MANEDGVVVSVDGGMVRIKSRRTEACDHCAAKDGCRVMGGGKDMEFNVENTLGANVGDQVQVTVSDAAFLRVIFLVYLVPIMGLMVGAVLGQELGESMGYDPSMTAAILGFACMGGVFAIVRVIAGRMDKSERYKPHLLKIVAKAGDIPEMPANE